MNKLWFSCPKCGREIDKRTPVNPGKAIRFIALCLMLFLAAFVVFIALGMYTVAISVFSAVMMLAIAMSIVSYKYDVFVRMEPIVGNDAISKAIINLNIEFIEERIYIIRAKYKNKVNVKSMYIAALSNYSREDSTCDVRFIKPQEAKGLIDARKFEIYDDDKFVGKGEFIV